MNITIPQFYYDPVNNMVMDLVESSTTDTVDIVFYNGWYDSNTDTYYLDEDLLQYKQTNTVDKSQISYTLVTKDINYSNRQEMMRWNLFYNAGTDTLYSN